jgi:hypothetical protein
VQSILSGSQQQLRGRCQRVNEQRGPPSGECRIGMGHSGRQQGTSDLGGGGTLRHQQHRCQIRMGLHANGPEGLLVPPGDHEAAQQAGADIVGMPVEPSRKVQRSLVRFSSRERITGQHSGDRGRR